MDLLENQNVVWDTPSDDCNGSMPIGNGDIGLNVWFERSGDLLLYISKTDAWDGNCSLLKLGRIRMTFTPNPFAEENPFRQILNLRHGEILINLGEGDARVSLKIWVDANRPVIRIEADGGLPFDIRVTLEIWRRERRRITDDELLGVYGLAKAPFPVYVEPDKVVDNKKNELVWYHRNTSSIWSKVLEHQGLAESIPQAVDPLLSRTFGACVQCDGLEKIDNTVLRSVAARRHYMVSIFPLCAQTETVEQWLTQLADTVNSNSNCNIEECRTEHRNWWNSFWDRSWIYATGSPVAEKLTQAYTLQRWINACGGRGKYPIKFNGSIFTVDGTLENEKFDADYRRWGGGYWFQNTRLAYWSMLTSGDFDLMSPLFKMYNDALPLARARTRAYYNHDGAFFPETGYFWGTYNCDNYGWQREGLPAHLACNEYIRYYWQSGLELLFMMLDFYQHTLDSGFVIAKLLPLATEILTFFSQHWQRDKTGKIRFEPAMALETYGKAVNPLPEIVGIKQVTDALLKLPQTLTTADQREFWGKLQNELPEVPVREVNGKTVLAPAEIYEQRQNVENPELYAVFPYRLYGVGKPEIELAQKTFEQRVFKADFGWSQDGIQAARLGLTKAAATDVVARINNKHEASRFPAFWGPNYDWVPDQDHGANLMTTIQSMLLQADGDEILLFPAWPDEWDVDFKLHAPGQTVVEASLRTGKVENLTVEPCERHKNVEVLTGGE